MIETNFQNIARPQGYNAATWGSARLPLSTSPAGEPINIVSGSVGNGTLVHTFPVDVNALEEVYLYASNYGSSTVNITMSFATSSAGAFNQANQIIAPIANQNGPILCYPGIPHKSTDPLNSLKMYVPTGTSDSINIFGYILRYYPKSSDRNNTSYGYVVSSHD